MKTVNKDQDDQVWIDMFDPLCVARWTDRLHITEKQLFEITRNVGGYARSVQRYVETHKAFSSSLTEN